VASLVLRDSVGDFDGRLGYVSVPVSFRLILPEGQTGHKTENALFREMVKPFEPPAGATFVIVGGDVPMGPKRI